MAHIGAERFAAMPFPLRPKASQLAIVDYLDASLSSIAQPGWRDQEGLWPCRPPPTSHLKNAFEGELVPQDPSDEPPFVLLKRIRAARAQTPALMRYAKDRSTTL